VLHLLISWYIAASTLSEDTRNALNALLYQTGTASHNFMLVLATNRAEDLDDAVLDRMVYICYLSYIHHI
jgi:SpoVK/Ycf46/Vps4 family AAA+-type ATPase